MKLRKHGFWFTFVVLILSGAAVIGGCGKGEVPNSKPEDIESAKFDAEKAENPNPMETAIPPD